jgi:hypothetical protein
MLQYMGQVRRINVYLLPLEDNRFLFEMTIPNKGGRPRECGSHEYYQTTIAGPGWLMEEHIRPTLASFCQTQKTMCVTEQMIDEAAERIRVAIARCTTYRTAQGGTGTEAEPDLDGQTIRFNRPEPV